MGMKGSFYRERDYGFGQAMLTLRTKLGLTQAALADRLGVRRRTVSDWEGGLTYPNVDHLKHVVVLAIECQAWPVGHEAEEIRALWQMAHQKVLLDEGGKLQGSFTLQSVVMEYVTARLIAEVTNEIKQGRCWRLVEHGLELAPCQEYVRQSQQRLLVVPILTRLRSSYPKRAALEEQLFALLSEYRSWEDSAQGYGPANLLALLRELRGHLRGLNLSQLSLRGAHLQGVEMQDTTLAGALLQETVFTGSFDAPWSVATGSNGLYWAMGSRRGEARVWRDDGNKLSLA